LPELNHLGDQLENEHALEKNQKGKISFSFKMWILFLQNIGILIGFGIMLVTAVAF